MKRTSKLILLLVGFVAASCILQIAIVASNIDPGEVHQYVNEQRFVAPDTLWSVFKPVASPRTTDGELHRQVRN